MSRASLPAAMWRIQGATPESPLALFEIPHNCEHFNVVFAATLSTQAQLRYDFAHLVGIFDQTMSMREVREILERNLKKRSAPVVI